MNRQEFMNQLERLLSDVPEAERQDALAYYEDYFDEAGPEQEAQVIQDLGSPGRVAATIKADLKDGGRNRGEFTENGYQDSRFREQSQTPARRADGAEKTGKEEFRKNLWQQHREERREQRQPKGIGGWALLILAICLIGPILLGVGGGLLGLIAGAAGLVLALALSGALMVGGGIFSIVISAVRLAAHPAGGLVGIGVGLLVAALGILLVLLFIWLAFQIFPRVFRWSVEKIQKLFRHGKGEEGESE